MMMAEYFENKFYKLTYDEVRDRLDALKKVESVDIEIKTTFVDKDIYQSLSRYNKNN